MSAIVKPEPITKPSFEAARLGQITLYDQWDKFTRTWPLFQERPWLLTIWEPLKTKAPNPNLAAPYCCYINTVIFYVRPHTVRPWHHLWRSGRISDTVLVCNRCKRRSSAFPCEHCQGKDFIKQDYWPGTWRAEKPGMSYEEWGRADTELRWDLKVEYNGQTFICNGGRVVWKHKRWWMERGLRREQAAA